jgi:2-phosphosulfolactate phosphatase
MAHAGDRGPVHAVARWQDCPALGKDDLAVVFDVLRATSAVTAAFAAGVAAVLPVESVDAARAYRTHHGDVWLAGEEHNLKPPGFDRGNSPREWGPDSAGRQVVWSTTNGTRALRRVAGAGRVLVGALVNRRAVAAQAAEHPGPIWLVAAGTRGEWALEDWLAVGAVATLLDAARWTDASRAAALAFTAAASDLAAVVAASSHARDLIAQGFAADLEWCAHLDRLDLVGELRPDGWIRVANRSRGL